MAEPGVSSTPIGMLRGLWHSDLGFREQLVTAAAIVGVPVCWVTALMNAIQGNSAWTVALNVAAGFATLGLLWLARSTGRYRLTYLTMVIALFLVLFPWFFFAGGGYHSGMPAFFVFAVVFTAFFLEGWTLWTFLVLELLVFVGCIVAAYLQPGWVRPMDSEFAVMVDVAYCVVAASVALVLSLRLLIRIYQRNRDELARRNDELARIDRTRQEFLAVVAHELNTPLTVIRAHAEEAAAQAADPLARADLAVIGAESDRLARLVSQLLDLARIESGTLELHREPLPLTAIVQEVLQAYRPLLTRDGNTVEVSRDGASPVVLVDRERVTQVLVNLLSNAARHTADGTITITVADNGDLAEFSVVDTGDGIDQARLASLAGARPAGLRTARDTGLGVGLAVSRQIIAAHGGTMTIESAPGAGTTVRCTLPLAPSAA